MRRFWLALLLSVSSVAVADLAVAKEPQPQVVVITIPFLELHTGPAEVYPVTRVVERGEELEVLKSRTGWFKVRGPRGYEGWVEAEKLQAAIAPRGD